MVVVGKFRLREAVCRMCVCGMDTVIIMRRGGFGDGGAAANCVVFGKVSAARETTLCFYNHSLVFVERQVISRYSLHATSVARSVYHHG
jgi:hypothetical protein